MSLPKLGREFKIVRNDVNQIETDLTSGTVSIEKIKWLNPCEYELSLVSRKIIGPDTLPHPPPGAVLKIKIVSTGTDYYVFEAKLPDTDYTYSDTMWLTKSR